MPSAVLVGNTASGSVTSVVGAGSEVLDVSSLDLQVNIHQFIVQGVLDSKQIGVKSERSECCDDQTVGMFGQLRPDYSLSEWLFSQVQTAQGPKSSIDGSALGLRPHKDVPIKVLGE
jgi:hypothetical protein